MKNKSHSFKVLRTRTELKILFLFGSFFPISFDTFEAKLARFTASAVSFVVLVSKWNKMFELGSRRNRRIPPEKGSPRVRCRDSYSFTFIRA